MLYNNFHVFLDKIIPKDFNPLNKMKSLSKIKDYFAQAKIAAIIIGVILLGILIALTILIVKKIKKNKS